MFNSAMTGSSAELTLGGKDVTLVTATLGGNSFDESYYYGYNDVVFKVSGSSEEVIAMALSLLP